MLWTVILFAVVVTASIAFLLLPEPGQEPVPSIVDSFSPSAPASQPRLGTNLNEVNDWSTQLPFIDLFKQSRHWFTQCESARDADCDKSWDTGESDRLDLDAQGWVRSLPDPQEPGYSIAATVLALPETVPAGRYLMLYEGSGELRYRLGARRIEAESIPGRDVLELDPARGIVHIQIYATDPEGTGDYLRNLRLVREDREALLNAGEQFNPDMLERIRPFEVLRFMDWMRTNGSSIAHWEQRARPDDATYASAAGVPPEVMLDLADQLGVAIWLNVPHQADDDFVRQLALLVRDKLNPETRVYLEYSNEVWNAAFPQQAWVAAHAEALWPDRPNSSYTKTINWYGKRSAEICSSWKQVFGVAADRVICVMAGQAANSWVVKQALECPLWDGGAPCAAHGIDAIAIANYFGAYLGRSVYESRLEDWASQGANGLDILFTELEHGGLLPDAPEFGAVAQAADRLSDHVELADQFGMPVLGYEGGQHLVGTGSVVANAAITELLVSANRDPRMGQLYERYLSDWESHGGALLMHYIDIATPGRYGSFGTLEYVDQGSSPKYEALLNY